MNSKIIGNRNKRRVEQRQEQASARQELRWKRTSKEQLNRLDDLLGKDLGAVKERTRLLESILEKEQEVVVVDEKIQSDEKANVKKTKARLSPKAIKKLKKQQKNEIKK